MFSNSHYFKIVQIHTQQIIHLHEFLLHIKFIPSLEAVRQFYAETLTEFA